MNSLKAVLLIFSLLLSAQALLHAKCSDELKRKRSQLVSQLSPQAYVETLGLTMDTTPTKVAIANPLPIGRMLRSVDGWIINIKDAANKTVAYTWFSLHNVRNLWGKKVGVEAKIAMSSVYGHSDMYLSTAMYNAIFTAHPEITEVSGDLISDNASAFKVEYKKNRDKDAAFKATPFYKAMSRFGFSEIDNQKSSVSPHETGDDVSLTLVLKRGAPRIPE